MKWRAAGIQADHLSQKAGFLLLLLKKVGRDCLHVDCGWIENDIVRSYIEQWSAAHAHSEQACYEDQPFLGGKFTLFLQLAPSMQLKCLSNCAMLCILEFLLSFCQVLMPILPYFRVEKKWEQTVQWEFMEYGLNGRKYR